MINHTHKEAQTTFDKWMSWNALAHLMNLGHVTSFQLI